MPQRFRGLSTELQLRDACDDCHYRKVRCIAAANGCRSCQQNGRHCRFSPRSQMGRPRTQNPGEELVEMNTITNDWKHLPLLREGNLPFLFGDQSFDNSRSTILQTENHMYNHMTKSFADSSTSPASMLIPSSLQLAESFPFQQTYSDITTQYVGDHHCQDQISPYISTSESNQSIFTDTSCQPGDPLLDGFSELLNIQLDLHRQRDQLTSTEPDTHDIAQVAGLGSILKTVSAICTVTHDILRKSNTLNVSTPMATPLALGGTVMNGPTFLLTLTIIREGLNIYEVLVRIAHTIASHETHDFGQSAANIRAERMSCHGSLDDSTSMVDPCSYFIDQNAARGTSSSTAVPLASSLLTSCAILNEILVLTVMDLHLSFFDHFFLCCKDRSVGPSVASSLIEGSMKTGQVRQVIKAILDTSKKPWDY